MNVAEQLAGLLGPLLVSTDAQDLDDHAYDLSTAAMLAEREASRPFLPVCIVRPRSVGDVAELLEWADRTTTPIVPYGAGSGVVEGIQPEGAVVVDMGEMNRIVDIDEKSRLVRVEAGARGPRLHEALAEVAFTLGHEPQSIDISTVGGWLATRATGQLSSYFGGIDELAVALEAVLPGGRIASSKIVPRRAAGPDVASLLIGSEGTLGIITEAVLRIAPEPWRRADRCVVFEHLADGIGACRKLAQSDLRPLLLRLYDRDDAGYFFHKLRPRPDGHTMLLSFAGPDCDEHADQALEDLGGEVFDVAAVRYWWEHRNDAFAQYRRMMMGEGILGPHAVVDTMEVAGSWTGLRELYHTMKVDLSKLADFVGCHLSHVYPDGACLYFTLAGSCADEDEARRKHQSWWETGMETCLRADGAISHHHGIGRLKARWLQLELGSWWDVLVAVKRAIDPNRIMNPGALGL